MKVSIFCTLLIAFLSANTQAGVRCENSFETEKFPSQFPTLKNETVVSLYINRDLISKNQQIWLDGKSYIIRNWYQTKNGPVLIAETAKQGKPKILNSSDFKDNLIVIDEVRLADLLSYQNERVTNRYMRDFKASPEEAQRVFTDLMKWFYLLHRYASEGYYFEKNPKHFELGMYDETQKIDNMWHTFILFTIDYTDFGWQQLGYYQHHQPFDQVQPKSKAQTLRERQLMYGFIAASLGVETLRDWFVDMAFADPQTPIKNHIPVEAELLNANTLP
ncbi:MAG: hypothetical protein AAGB31_00125 [Bdellovibrio sp.]